MKLPVCNRLGYLLVLTIPVFGFSVGHTTHAQETQALASVSDLVGELEKIFNAYNRYEVHIDGSSAYGEISLKESWIVRSSTHPRARRFYYERIVEPSDTPALRIEMLCNENMAFRAQQTIAVTAPGKSHTSTTLFGQQSNRDFVTLTYFGSGLYFGVNSSTRSTWMSLISRADKARRAVGSGLVALTCQLHDDGGMVDFFFEQSGTRYVLKKIEFRYNVSRDTEGKKQSEREVHEGAFADIEIDSESGGISAFRLDVTVFKIDGKQKTKSGSQQAQSRITTSQHIESFSCEEFRFSRIEVVDGSRVFMVDDKHVRYEYVDGKVKKIADSDAIKSFREIPQKESSDNVDRSSEAQGRTTYDEERLILRPYLRSADTGAHCGVYCLAGAATALNASFDLDRLLDGRFVGDWRGSSAQELCDGAQDLGLHGRLFSAADVAFLKSITDPIILHLAESRNAEATNHWILYLGSSGEDAIILDPPRAIDRVPFAELLSYWDGAGVIISKHPISGRTAVVRQGYQLRWLAVPIGIACVLWLGVRFWRPLQAYSTTKKPRAVVQQTMSGAGIIIGVSVVWAIAWNVLSPIGFMQNSHALAHVQSKIPSIEKEFPQIGRVALDSVVANQEVTLVDARMPVAYNRGHIPSAVSLPVDASLGEWNSALEKIDKQKPVVVYCQNSGCRWDEILANRLRYYGFRDIRLFVAGYDGYKSAESFNQ